MSRAFVKEEDQEETPIVPQRAPLPPGHSNYVTPAGMQALMDEKSSLEKEREKALQLENETEKRVAKAVVTEKMQLLENRIASAQILDPNSMPPDEVRFGATVTLAIGPKGIKQKFQLVGVDEADVKLNKVAFTSPIALAITGKKIGEEAILKLGKEERPLKILDIQY